MPPAPAQAALEQALAHHRANRLEPARLGYARVRQLAPRGFEGHYLGGLVALQLDHLGEALPLLQQATAINPQHDLAFHCLGSALLRSGRHAEARRAIERTLALNPRQAEAWANLGAALSQTGDYGPAQAAYRRAIDLAPQSADAWSGLGAVALLQGRPEEALAHQEKALQLDPRHPRAGLGRGQALFQLCEVGSALAAFEQHLAHHPSDLVAHSQRLLLLHYGDDCSTAELVQAHLNYGTLAAQQPPLPTGPAHRKAPRLRLGFVSPDFRQHSVASFLEPLLTHLDRTRCEVWLYHDHGTQDATTARLRALANGFRSVVGQGDDRVAQQIHADQIDVLVDLCGHTGSNRMTLFARRVAPLQVTYLGYPNTTGLATMDLRLVDSASDPLEPAAESGPESLVRFHPCAWSYRPPEDAPPPNRTQDAEPGVVFGCFNNASKWSDTLLRHWAHLLQTCPGSRLILKSSGLRPAHVAPRLAKLGLPLDRITLLPATATTREHLSLYQQVDVALDTYPYHGTTTTCEALYMGVPVVSWCGDRHASRVGASLLRAVGHPEWTSDTGTNYVTRAASLASNVDVLRSQRQALREAFLRCPLSQPAAHAQAWLDAVATAYDRRVSPALLSA